MLRKAGDDLNEYSWVCTDPVVVSLVKAACRVIEQDVPFGSSVAIVSAWFAKMDARLRRERSMRERTHWSP